MMPCDPPVCPPTWDHALRESRARQHVNPDAFPYHLTPCPPGWDHPPGEAAIPYRQAPSPTLAPQMGPTTTIQGLPLPCRPWSSQMGPSPGMAYYLGLCGRGGEGRREGSRGGEAIPSRIRKRLPEGRSGEGSRSREKPGAAHKEAGSRSGEREPEAGRPSGSRERGAGSGFPMSGEGSRAQAGLF